ncbi:MAG: inositol monophosphatase family protein, partial [Chloroflexota bacterium]
QKGEGAYLNQQNIRVSAISDMGKGLFSVSFPYGRDSRDFQDSLKVFHVMARDGQAVRREGSTALSLCAVAAGRFDGFCVIGNEVWDYAAGMLLVREAGGMVTDFQGQPFRIGVSRNQILASNGRVHDAVLKSFRDGGIS